MTWIKDKVLAIINGDHLLDEREFEHLCLHIAQMQGIVQEIDASSGVAGLGAIDPVPETAFKLMTVAHFPPSEAQAIFYTSGTTTGSSGRRFVQDLAIYRQSVNQGFKLFVMEDLVRARFISLIPDAISKPTSSLSHMASMVTDEFSSQVNWVRKGATIDSDLLKTALDQVCDSKEPVVILGTTLDFLTAFEWMKTQGFHWKLPKGSRAMHTGGSKALGRSISKNELWAGFESNLGIPANLAIEEYGMTELLSQAYDAPAVTPGPRRFVSVPWMKTLVLDPLTMLPVGDGQRGVLCHYDLANFDAAVAVLTQDVATAVENGFADIVRVVGAPSRGCSHEAATEAD